MDEQGQKMQADRTIITNQRLKMSPNPWMRNTITHSWKCMISKQFYADERWQKEKLTVSEQLLLVEQLQSLIKDAPISSHLHPTQKILELEYYDLLKLLERIQEDIEQSENIEIIARKREEEEEKEEHQQNNGY